MKENPDAKVLLNGSLDYMMLRPYIKLAEETNHEFSIVQREVGETDIFLVLAAKQEVDIENIQLEKTADDAEQESQADRISLLDKIKNLLK
ncbi:hypothetical protein MFLO_07967 [Listeria floridensis FSL S10-1187]|uniref:Uncharacterized protein n=1 Tax=Listeria floridensis FSL S10-1187 TaxID=1265817 RepID=A0ABN0RFI6_9LIST|nr:hypothetical protein MFLO_07967 [Listeria floridensis FSL S10-1187]